MRLAEWPRTPYLNDEVREWIRQQLGTLGVEEIAIFAAEAGAEGDERRILTATEIGLLDMYYAPAGSSARFRLVSRLYPWQAVRGVDLRVETFRLWALEDRSRWLLRMARPRFAYTTELPDLGRGLAEFARVAAIMAEPSGWQPPTDESQAIGATPAAEPAPHRPAPTERPAAAPEEETGRATQAHGVAPPPAAPPPPPPAVVEEEAPAPAATPTYERDLPPEPSTTSARRSTKPTVDEPTEVERSDVQRSGGEQREAPSAEQEDGREQPDTVDAQATPPERAHETPPDEEEIAFVDPGVFDVREEEDESDDRQRRGFLFPRR